MKLLFLIPPRAFFPEGLPDRLYGCSYSYDYKPPIHLCLLATMAQQAGHEVRLLDAIAEGMDGAAFAQFLADERCDAAVFFTVYVAADGDRRAAEVLRRVWGDRTPIVWTGAAPSWRPEDFALTPHDFVLRGEPEPGLEALLASGFAAPVEAVPGLSRCVDGRPAAPGEPAPVGALAHSPRPVFLDVDALPIPDRRLLRGRYRVNRLNVAPVTAAIFSRGCGYKCVFCAPMALDQAIEVEYKKEQDWYAQRPPLRLRSAAQVIEEFRALAALGYRGVEVADNVFHWNKARTLDICRGIEPLGLEWLCLNRAPQMQDPEVLDAMARAGCRLVYMGTESFDQTLLDDAHKGQQVVHAAVAVEKLRAAGIEPEVSVLIGASPKETADTARATIRAARALDTRFVHYGYVTPFPNTEYYDLARREGWLAGDYRAGDMIHQTQVNLPGLSGAEMHRLATRAARAHYLRPRAIWQHVRRVRSLGDLAHKSRMFLKWLGHIFRPAGRERAGRPSAQPALSEAEGLRAGSRDGSRRTGAGGDLTERTTCFPSPRRLGTTTAANPRREGGPWREGGP